jgi:transcriptional accessory protein Tex/SPT6
MSLEEAYAASMVEVEDGQIVEGTVVKVDRDEVLLDIGYKSEGVIPSRELSIRNDVDPSEIVSMGDKIEALVLQKEDKEGRLVLSKKRAQYERAWGTIEKIKEEDGVVRGPVIEVVKGGLILDIGLRGFLPASLVELRRVRDLQPYVGRSLEAKIIELDKNRNNVVLSARTSSPTSSRARSAPAWCRASSTSVPSSIWAAWTASCTCPSCPGSTSTIRARSSRSAMRSRCRSSRSISTASASACRSRPPSRTPGKNSRPRTALASWSTAG